VALFCFFFLLMEILSLIFRVFYFRSLIGLQSCSLYWQSHCQFVNAQCYATLFRSRDHGKRDGCLSYMWKQPVIASIYRFSALRNYTLIPNFHIKLKNLRKQQRENIENIAGSSVRRKDVASYI